MTQSLQRLIFPMKHGAPERSFFPNYLEASSWCMSLTPLPSADILEDLKGLMGCLQAWARGWVLEDNPLCNHSFPSLQNRGTVAKTKIEALPPPGAKAGAPPQTRELQSSIPALERGKWLLRRREGTRLPLFRGLMKSDTAVGPSPSPVPNLASPV